MDNLRILRNERGLTIQDLAKQMNVVQSTIQQYEVGINEPDIGMLIKLSDFFGVTIDYLVGHDLPEGPLDKEDEILFFNIRNLRNSAAKKAAIALLQEIRHRGKE